jgi:hypothetical protein
MLENLMPCKYALQVDSESEELDRDRLIPEHKYGLCRTLIKPFEGG